MALPKILIRKVSTVGGLALTGQAGAKRMQQKREQRSTDWRACVKLGKTEGY